MPVRWPSKAMPIRPDHVYVIPPNADLFIEHYTFKIVSPRSKRNVQIDCFLTSLAVAMGEHAIGIILSGYDGDGAEGCKQIKAKGGKPLLRTRPPMYPTCLFMHGTQAVLILFLPLDKISEHIKSLPKTPKRKAA